MTETGKLVEIQGTAEGAPFSRKDLEAMLDLGEEGIMQLIKLQKEALGLPA
jgi:ribonuclease PH